MATFSHSFAISEDNLRRLETGFTSSILFVFNGKDYLFNGIPYIESEDSDESVGTITKNYEYLETTLDIEIEISPAESDFTANVYLTLKENGNEISLTAEDRIQFDWSIDNSIVINDNDGYMRSIDDTVDYIYQRVNPQPEDNPAELGWYEDNEDSEASEEYILSEDSEPVDGKLYYEYIKKEYFTQNKTTNQERSFIRLDRFGLYGINNLDFSSNYTPKNITQVQNDAMFSLTWDGYTLKTSHPDGNGFIKIGATEDIVISTTSTFINDQGIEETVEDTVAKLGYLTGLPGINNPLEKLYGIYAKNIYIGDANNFLTYYKDTADISTFKIKTDNFEFNTDLEDGVIEERSVKQLIRNNTTQIDNMTSLYEGLNSWVRVGGTQNEPTLTLANYNKALPTEIEITSEAINFKLDNNIVAWISGNEMSIKNTSVSEKIRFGNYAFIKRNNGANMALKYIG